MFWKERDTKIFLTELLCVAMLGMTAALLLTRLQESRMQSLLFEHDAAIVSSLLEQGVSRQTASGAVACALGTWKQTEGQDRPGLTGESLEEGENLIRRIGIARDTDIRLIPVLHEFCAAGRVVVSLSGALFLLSLFFCVFRYLQRRDRIYREAVAAIEKSVEDDFLPGLPELYDGTLYQLFSRVNFMAALLKTKQETENKVKNFLKTTVSDISHQLKTPLAALSMYQEIMLSEPDRKDVVVRFAGKSETAVRRMEGLIQTLLKITRLDAGSVAFSGKICDAKELAVQALEEFTDRAEKEKKELLLSGESEAKVYCDPEWSREALANLVKNALDHTGEGDRIRISWEQMPLMTRFVVEDNGEGIAEEDIHHIFKRFYKSGDARSGQGTGLGLSLAKAIVDGQGGTISAQSEKGGGAVFTLSFPAERGGVQNGDKLTKL